MNAGGNSDFASDLDIRLGHLTKQERVVHERHAVVDSRSALAEGRQAQGRDCRFQNAQAKGAGVDKDSVDSCAVGRFRRADGDAGKGRVRIALPGHRAPVDHDLLDISGSGRWYLTSRTAVSTAGDEQSQRNE